MVGDEVQVEADIVCLSLVFVVVGGRKWKVGGIRQDFMAASAREVRV